MVITPVAFGAFVDRSMRPAIGAEDFSAGSFLRAGPSSIRSPNQAPAHLDFAAKLDEMLERIKLDGERLLMYGGEPEETEDQEIRASEQSSVDFTTYQLVLEAGQKSIMQSGAPPELGLSLFA